MLSKIQSFIEKLESEKRFGAQELIAAKAIATEANDQLLKNFCELELNGGFSDENIPSYRIKRGQPIGVFRNSFTGQIQETELDYSGFLKMIKVDPSEGKMRKIGNPISELEDFYFRSTFSVIKIEYTKDMLLFIKPFLGEDEKNGWILVNAYYEFPYSTFQQILDSIKSELFDHLIRLKSVFSSKNELKQVLIQAGKPFDGVKTLIALFENAKKEILLIDGYLNADTFTFFENKKKSVSIKIITDNRSKSGTLKLLITSFNNQFGGLEVEYRDGFHDRFLIIDQTEYYSIGGSIKDIGKKHSMISRIDDPKTIEDIRNLIVNEKH